MNDSLHRIPRVEFFAVLPAGLWILASISFSWAAAVDFGAEPNGADFFKRVAPLFDGMKSIPVALSVILLAYLLGHIPRAIGLELADRICVRWLRPWAGGNSAKSRPWAQVALGDFFPYLKMLEHTLKNVLGEKARLKGEHEPPVFTFHEMWKTTVRQLSPGGYAHLESLEARAHMYAALFWAGLFGALCGLTTLATVTTAFAGWGALALAFGAAFMLFGHWRSEHDHWQSKGIASEKLKPLNSPWWLVLTLASPCIIGLSWVALHRLGLDFSWPIDAGCLLDLVLLACFASSLLKRKIPRPEEGKPETTTETEPETTTEPRAKTKAKWIMALSASYPLIHSVLAVLTVAGFIYIAAEPALPVNGVKYSVWLRPAVALTLGSITLAAALGARLRTVRAEESQKVLLAYLTCVTDKNGALKHNLVGIDAGRDAAAPGGVGTTAQLPMRSEVNASITSPASAVPHPYG